MQAQENPEARGKPDSLGILSAISNSVFYSLLAALVVVVVVVLVSLTSAVVL